MLVTRSSPAPRSAQRAAQSTASRPVGVRPPWREDLPAGRLLAAAARVDRDHDRLRAEPRRRRRATSCGSSTAAVLIATLSAPASSRRSASSTERTPPPTVSGMNTCSAVRATTSTMRRRPLVRRGDVEEAELVGARRVVRRRLLDRIARVAQLHELHALDDAAVLDVEAGDDALRASSVHPPLRALRSTRERAFRRARGRRRLAARRHRAGARRSSSAADAARGDHRRTESDARQRRRRLDVRARRPVPSRAMSV